MSSATFGERDENDIIFGSFTVVGYFFINIILLVGVLAGDGSNIIMCLFNIFGFLLFLSLGSEQIDIYKHHTGDKSMAYGMGSMAILTSFIYLADSIFLLLDIHQKSQDTGRGTGHEMSNM